MRKAVKPIKEIDQTNESPEYWNSILKSFNLSMQRGYRPNVVTPIGGLFVLNKIDEKQAAKESGKVEPSGYGPDS